MSSNVGIEEGFRLNTHIHIHFALIRNSKRSEISLYLNAYQGFLHGSVVKISLPVREIQGDVGSIPRLGSPGGGIGNTTKYSCLKNSLDKEEPGGLRSLGSQRVDWLKIHEIPGSEKDKAI